MLIGRQIESDGDDDNPGGYLQEHKNILPNGRYIGYPLLVATGRWPEDGLKDSRYPAYRG